MGEALSGRIQPAYRKVARAAYKFAMYNPREINRAICEAQTDCKPPI